MNRRRGRPAGLIPDGEKIRSLRVDLGLTAAQVAEQIGFHTESVKRIERNGAGLSDVFASRLARVLGVNVEDIASPPQALASLDANKAPAAANDRGRAG